jgi:hypothetical protein
MIGDIVDELQPIKLKYGIKNLVLESKYKCDNIVEAIQWVLYLINYGQKKSP